MEGGGTELTRLPARFMGFRYDSVALSAERDESPEWWWFMQNWTKDKVLLVASVVGIMLTTTAERIAFKMSVDRLTPYRLVLTETVLVVSMFVYGLITVLKRLLTTQIKPQMNLFPHGKLLTMAALDTVHFSLLVCAGAGVTPTMTVILLHASTPIIVFGSKYVFPEREFSNVQMRGVYFIVAALVVGVLQQLWGLWVRGEEQHHVALSSLVYLLASCLHGASSLYKERAIVDWMQQIDLHFLNSWLFFYQCMVCVVLAPAIYWMQGVSSDWSGKGFPFSSMAANINDGLVCIWGDNDALYYNVDDAEDVAVVAPYDTRYTDCSLSLWIIVAFVLSGVAALHCVDRLLQKGNQLLGRATSAAVFVSFVTLGVYDTQMDLGDGIGGSTIGGADLVSILILLAGLEWWGRDEAPGDYLPSGEKASP